MATLEELRGDLRADLLDDAAQPEQQFFDNTKLDRYLKGGARVLGYSGDPTQVPDDLVEDMLLYAKYLGADAYRFNAAQLADMGRGPERVTQSHRATHYGRMAQDALAEFNRRHPERPIGVTAEGRGEYESTEYTGPAVEPGPDR